MKPSVALLVALAGCGGEGWSFNTRFLVEPAQAEVNAGGEALRLTANFGYKPSEPLRWSLSGPGSLDRASGTHVLYTPPASLGETTTALVSVWKEHNTGISPDASSTVYLR